MLGYEHGELIGRDGHATLHRRADGTPFPAEDCPLPAGTATRPPRAASGARTARCCRSPTPPRPCRWPDGLGSVVVFRDVSAERAEAAASEEAELLDPQLRGAAPDADRQPAGHQRVPARSRPRILVADGEAIRRLAWLGADMFRGRKVAELYAEVPDRRARALARELPRRAAGRAARVRVRQRGPDVRDPGGARVRATTAPSSRARRRPRRHRAHPRRAAARAAARASRTPSPTLGRFALESHDLDALMNEAVKTATATLGVDMASVLELDEAGERADPGGRRRRAGSARSAPSRCRSTRARTPATPCAPASPSIVEDLAAETRFQPSAAAAGARRRQQRQRPDRGSRPAVRRPQRPRARAARVHRGRGRVPHRARDADHRRRRARPRRAGDAPRRAARPAHRPAEPHARARPARARARPPAARAASTSRSSCSTSTASS